MKQLYLYIISFLVFSQTLYADTVYLKSGEEEKGIIVEDYYDRIILSTVDGEIEVKKSDITNILYDKMEQNLVRLGDFHEQKGNLIKAHSYFKKATELNPIYKEAQDRFIHIRSVLLGRPEKIAKDEMNRKRLLFKESGKVYLPEIKEGVPITLEERFKAATGLTLISENSTPQVKEVLPGSAAEKAGIKPGDFIIIIWGKLTGYLNLSDIEKMVIESPTPEIALSIKRKIVLTFGPATENRYDGVGGIGVSLDIKDEGVFVVDVIDNSIAKMQGIEEKDFLESINGKPTRYMPVKDVIKLINESSSKGMVELDVIRDTTLWRKEP